MEYKTLSGGIEPDTGVLQRDAILESMLDHISDYEKKYPLVDIQELKDSVISKVVAAPKSNDVNFSQEVQLRGFLRAFEKTSAYHSQFNILDSRTQQQIDTFKERSEDWRKEPIWEDTKKKGFLLPETNAEVSKVLPTSPARRSISGSVKRFFSRAFVNVAQPLVLLLLKLRMARAARRLENQAAKKYARGPVIYEDEKGTKPMDNLVLFAQQNNLRVRCGGYRHSWSRTFSQDKEILISLLPVLQVTMLPDPMSIHPSSQSVQETELNKIELLKRTSEVPEGKIWCRVGVAVTNEAFRRWAIENKTWSLPVDVILVE
ncbi:MAG: hypothetical protein Q9195_005380 [Heterodermia aff. obscurata]